MVTARMPIAEPRVEPAAQMAHYRRGGVVQKSVSAVPFACFHLAVALAVLVSLALAGEPAAAQSRQTGVIQAQWVAPWHKQTPRSAPARPSLSGKFRTVCVRLCDGFFFPISYSARRSQFSADAQLCEARCPAKARLFIYRNPGQELRHAVDLKGNRYADLENAFRYRTELVKGCECQPGGQFATDADQPPAPPQGDSPPAAQPEQR